MLRDPGIGLVLFDELNIALKLHYLDVEQVIADLRARPPMQHVVITGRGAPPALVEAADTVTDMTPVKHAFQQGIKAQRGVEM
jgi:cob(I)alamin adenosyltransferase